jgi:hypothetical protein
MAASPHPTLNPHADPTVVHEQHHVGVALFSVGFDATGNRSRIPWRRISRRSDEMKRLFRRATWLAVLLLVLSMIALPRPSGAMGPFLLPDPQEPRFGDPDTPGAPQKFDDLYRHERQVIWIPAVLRISGLSLLTRFPVYRVTTQREHLNR